MPRVSRPYHHGDLRRALLDAALAVLHEAGPAGLTLRAAARRAGVSHQAPYHHFADRAALVAAVAQDGFDRLAAELARVEATTADPVRRLQETGVAYVVFAVKHPDHFRVMFGPELAERKSHPDLARAAWQVFTQLMAPAGALFGAGKGKGGAGREPKEPSTMGPTLWALVHGLAMLLIDRQLPGSSQPATARRLALAVTEQMWMGLRAGVGGSGSGESGG